MITSEQLRAARALLRWEQKTLAEASSVSLATIKRFEGRSGPISANQPTLNAVLRCVDAAGVEFIAENGGGAGVRLKRGAQTEKTASVQIEDLSNRNGE